MVGWSVVESEASVKVASVSRLGRDVGLHGPVKGCDKCLITVLRLLGAV